jgi:hypothetical protein
MNRRAFFSLLQGVPLAAVVAAPVAPQLSPPAAGTRRIFLDLDYFIHSAAQLAGLTAPGWSLSKDEFDAARADLEFNLALQRDMSRSPYPRIEHRPNAGVVFCRVVDIPKMRRWTAEDMARRAGRPEGELKRISQMGTAEVEAAAYWKLSKCTPSRPA